MRQYQRLLIANILFIGAWFCLLSAGVGTPENPDDLFDTRGLPVVTIYTVALQVVGFLAIVFSGLGMFVAAKIKSNSFGIKLSIFFVSNILLLLASFMGVFVIVSFVLGTISGVSGISLYIGVICLVTTAAPKST
ncbi:hypothetical protein ACYZTX_27475 [Pseudomonas sp. MDT1-17]